jgi:hypothetical protein
MVVAAAGIDRDDTHEVACAKLLECVGDVDVADRLASATGLSPRRFPLHEVNWGARRFMQRLAEDGPVLAMIDDIHWAEPAFLDLIENMIDTIDDAPVLLVATSRHDLLETRPQWGQRERSTRLVLDPLSDDAAARVVRNLLGSSDLPEAVVKRIVAAAEGNPLYVEQMLSMLVDGGALGADRAAMSAQAGADMMVPPTIRALLEARLGKLERNERAAAEPASVIGMEFACAAVESLAPEQIRATLGDQFQALARKHFIQPASHGPAQRYRFNHHLVRDTVYSGMLKRDRATMHAEFVQWADRVYAESDRGQEFEAILGYHLEQAYHYLAELGPIDEAGRSIGRDAARRLSSAGRDAFGRGDMHAAANLFRRAIRVLDKQDSARLQLLTDLGEVLMEVGDFAESRTVLDEAQIGAEKVEDHRIAASARLFRMRVRFFSAEPGDLGRRDLAHGGGSTSAVRIAERTPGAGSGLATHWSGPWHVGAIRSIHGCSQSFDGACASREGRSADRTQCSGAREQCLARPDACAASHRALRADGRQRPDRPAS